MMTKCTSSLVILQVIDEEIDWENIMDDLACGGFDDHPLEDDAEVSMQME